MPRKRRTNRAAIVALDLLTDFDFPDGPTLLRTLRRAAPRIRALLRRARTQRIPVIYANDNLGPWRSDVSALLARCEDGARAGATLVRSLRPEPEDFIVLKPRHSAFFATPLAVLLDDLEVDTLILSGVSAESCVWMTACDAHTRGFQIVVPADTIAGVSARALRATLASLRDVLNARIPDRSAALRLHTRRVS